MEGHNLKANDSSYVHTSGDELLTQYLKAHDNLTISQEKKLLRKVEMLTIERSKVDLALSQIDEMKKRLKLA